MSNQLFMNPYPYSGFEMFQKSFAINGSVQLYGTYPSGGEPLNFTKIVQGFGINEKSPLGLGPQAANGSANVTALSASAGTITATAANNFVIGQQVTFVGCTTTLGLLLNGQTVTVVTCTSSQFTFTNAATGTGSSETGIVFSSVSPGQPYYGLPVGTGPKLTASVTALSASGTTLTVTAANNFLPGTVVQVNVATGTLGPALAGLNLPVLGSTGTAFTALMPSALTGSTGTGTASGNNPTQPYQFSAWSTKGSGYAYVYDSTLGVLHVQQGGAAVSSPNADISSGTYNATILADTVRIEAVFNLIP